MKKFLIVFLSFICVLDVGARNRRSHSRSITAASESVCLQVAKNALQITNKFRATKGLSKLAWNQEIAEIARKHSINMANNTVDFGHDGFQERVDSFSRSYKSTAENVFMGNYKDDIAQIAVDSWIGSKGHLANLIGNYTDCGIGVYQNAEGYWYFTQMFALFY